MAWLPARLRTRLALRIYLIGLLQVTLVALGFVAYARLSRPDYAQHAAWRDTLLEAIGETVDDPAALQQLLDSSLEEHGFAVTVTTADGERLASTMPPHAPPCLPHRATRRGRPGSPPHGPPPGHLAGPPPDHPHHPHAGHLGRCRVTLVARGGGDYAQVEIRTVRPPRPPSPFGPPVIVLVLVVVGASTLVLSRSIARPLKKLSAAARALGQGDLSARTSVERSDELGDVARSFDDMAERFQALLRAERELVANVSHELRTPLARIRVALDIASEGDAETVRESLRDIADDLDELEQLIADVLTAARLDLVDPAREGGIPPLRRQRLSLDTLLAEAVDRFRATHADRPVTLSLADDLPAVDGDRALLRRVFTNLLDNAHKYSDVPASEIAIAADRDDDGSVITVSDSGIGIDADDLARIFEPFYRADKSRTRATGGQGLGLALVRRIVDAHGGTITIDSNLGEGTRVRVCLPPADQGAIASKKET